MLPLGERLTADVTRLALCWRLRRSDGIALGFTTHDRPLQIAGMRHESAPGVTPSAIVSSADLAVDTMDVAGALTADAITAADLAAGRYDGAAIEIFMVDWQQPDAGRQMLARGHLGSVEAGLDADSGFVASFRGPTAALAITAVESYSPQCRAELGDRRCRVAMAARTRRLAVTRSSDDGIELLAPGASVADFIDGRLRVLVGPMAGIERRIIAANGSLLVPDEALPIAPGTAVQVWEGCDKSFEVCRNRFGNALNFQGEPHVPGADLLTRFGAD